MNTLRYQKDTSNTTLVEDEQGDGSNGNSIKENEKSISQNITIGTPPDPSSKLSPSWMIISYIIPALLLIIVIFYFVRCRYIKRKHEKLQKEYEQYKLAKKSKLNHVKNQSSKDEVDNENRTEENSEKLEKKSDVGQKEQTLKLDKKSKLNEVNKSDEKKNESEENSEILEKKSNDDKEEQNKKTDENVKDFKRGEVGSEEPKASQVQIDLNERKN